MTAACDFQIATFCSLPSQIIPYHMYTIKYAIYQISTQ